MFSFQVTQSSHMILIKNLADIYFRLRKSHNKISIRNMYVLWNCQVLRCFESKKDITCWSNKFCVCFWVSENKGWLPCCNFSCEMTVLHEILQIFWNFPPKKYTRHRNLSSLSWRIKIQGRASESAVKQIFG